MTKKQIIIDGERMFKCVWCKYDFKESDANFILSENPNECVCSGCMTEWADNLLWDFKRKEEECEELKQWKNGAENLFKAQMDNPDKVINRYKQALDEIEKTFFDTFGIRAYYKYLLIDKTSRCHNEKLFDKTDFIDFVKSGKDYLLLKVIKYPPQITNRILLELICLNDIYLWETHTSTVNELKNVLLNKYIEYVNLMADENEKQEYINQVQSLFKEEK